ncbi:MAG: DUF4345 domain-containing protein [Actinomycetota bacterium]
MNVTDRPHSPTLATRPHLPHRRVWQAVILLLALIPTTTSSITLALGARRFVDAADVDVAFDNTYRYLGGVYLGIALLALWCVPRIEERVQALLFVAGAIFLGGVGRLVSIADVGTPSGITWALIGIEMGVLFLTLALRRSIQPAPVLAD